MFWGLSTRTIRTVGAKVTNCDTMSMRIGWIMCAGNCRCELPVVPLTLSLRSPMRLQRGLARMQGRMQLAAAA